MNSMQIKSQVEHRVHGVVRDALENPCLQARKVWLHALDRTTRPVIDQVYIPLLNRIQLQLEQDIKELNAD
jgi:hypothetical protein